MIPPPLRRRMRITQTGADLSPVDYFQKISNLLMLAPLEEWRELLLTLAGAPCPGRRLPGLIRNDSPPGSWR